MKVIGDLEFNVYGIRFSADGKRVVVPQISAQTQASTLVCFDVTATKELWRLPRKGGELAFSPDGKTVVSAAFDKDQGMGFHIVEVDPESGKSTESFTPYNGAHNSIRMVIAPDNRTLMMNQFGEILMWDLRTRKEVRRFALPKTNGNGYGPDIGAISPDGRTLITNVGHLQRWDLTTAKAFFAAPPDDGLGGPIQHLAFTPDGTEVFASSWSLTSGRWDVATGKQVKLADKRYGRQLIRTREGLRTVGIDSTRRPSEATVSDPVAGKVLQTVHWTDPKEITINGLRAYTLTANGKTLLAAHGKEPGAANQTTYVTACDVASGRRLVRFAVSRRLYFERSPFSPCGRWVVLGEKVYHVGTGTELFAPAGEPGERLVAWDRRTHGSVWFSDDGRLMAGLVRKKEETSSARDTLAVWELASGQILARFPKAAFVAQVAFSPNNRIIALLDGRGIRLEDILTGKRLAEYAAPDVTCELIDRGCTTQTLAFAPDGRTLATGHLDGTVLLWEVPRPRGDGAPALAEGEAEKLWRDLGRKSPALGRAAVERLVRDPAEAVALLARRFRPPASPVDPTLAALLKDLDSDVFATREEASRKLRKYGAKAEPVLRRALAGTPSLEMRRRIEAIRDAITPPMLRLPLSDDALRGVRAIEVLERAGSSEAVKVLQSWAEQTLDMRLASEVRMALERLDPPTSAK